MTQKLRVQFLQLVVIKSNPQALRNEIKLQCSQDYVWFLSHYREWLGSALPTTQMNKELSRIDWELRDKSILEQLKKLPNTYSSLSAIDRDIGGHNWLLKYQAKLPLSTFYTFKLVSV